VTAAPAPTLRVAVAQAAATSGDVAGNAGRAATAVERAAADGARVVVLPELYLPGYDLATLGRDPGLDLAGADDPRLDAVRDACRRTGTVALVSASMRTSAGRTIAVVAVDAEGAAVHAYDKQHVTPTESAVFVSGTRGAVVRVDGWSLGLGVCYDGCFPEHARAAADADAWAYVVPAAYVTGGEHRRDLYYAARALDNGMYVAMAGLVGRCGDKEFGGGSAVHDPEGRRVAGVPDGVEGVALADLHAQAVADTRAEQTMGADRRPDLGAVRTLALA
jgi:predicted amidohydrolase